jgi:hypothetical protein
MSVCPSSCLIFEPLDEFRLKFGNVSILMSLAEFNFQNVDLQHISVDEKSTNLYGKNFSVKSTFLKAPRGI